MPVLRLFGSPALETDDGRPVEGRASQRHRIALLALLARSRGGCTRDKLIALLWAEGPADRGRSSLNESIYVLRRAFGDGVILSSGDELRLGADSLAVDVALFDEALARGDASRAAEIYRGPFMDGFFLSRAGEFERWMDAERVRLADAFRGALERLAVDAERRGDALVAVAHWRHLAAESPLDARIAMRLMEALVAAGNAAGALEHGRVHAALAAEEMGLPPDARIAGLTERIRAGWTPVPASAFEAPRLDQLPNDVPSARQQRRGPSRRTVALAAAAVVVLGTAAMVVRYERPTVPRATVPPSASALYERGRSHLAHHREAEVRDAIAAFDTAIALDGGFARAHAGLAIASAEMHLRFASVDEAPGWGQRAVREARAALALDSTLAEAHEALAAVYRKSEFDWEATIAESRRALQLDPSAPQPWFYMAGALYHLGLLAEAERAVHMGLDAQPSADRTEALRTLGTIALAAGRYTEAATLLQDVQRLSDRPVSDTHLAFAYYYAGESARAEHLLEPLLTSRSASAAARADAALASFAAARGDRDRARTLLAAAERGMVDHHVAYSIGVAYAQLGNGPSAVRWLRTAAETGFRCYPWYARDPLLEPLRRDSSYQALEEELRRGWERDGVRFGP